jgi:hypothetical protein
MICSQLEVSVHMRNTFATVFTGCVLAALISLQAQAMPLAPSQAVAGAPSVTLVEGGCGPGFHRGELGRCRANEHVVVEPVPGVVVVEPRVRLCPPGTHLGPEGRACRPN